MSRRHSKTSTFDAEKRKSVSLVVTIRDRTLRTTKAFDTFWKYTAERNAVEEKRRAREPFPWTDDKLLQNYRFCSVYRVADRGSQFLIREVIERGSQTLVDIAFRVILYNIFTKRQTFELLEETLSPLTWKTYDRKKYVQVLSNAKQRGQSIYTSAFQKPAPSLGESSNFRNHLVLLEVMMEKDIVKCLSDCKYMADAYDWINQLPGMGGFLAFQLVLDLSYTPLLNFHPNDFVVAGVGAVKGLKKCFQPASAVNGIESDIIRWMTKTQFENFARLGLQFAGLGPDNLSMTVCDIEHTLCEVHKYTALQAAGGKNSTGARRFRPGEDLDEKMTLPKAWDHPERMKTRIKRGVHQQVEKQYVVNRIIDNRKNEDGENELLVDWLGYTAADRTWEPEVLLSEDAPLTVNEYWQTH